MKNNHKREIARTLLGASLLFGLVACGGGGNNSTPETNPPDANPTNETNDEQVAGSLATSWEWLHPTPVGGQLNAVAVGDGTYVAVGETGGLIAVSDDGLQWEAVDSGGDARLADVAFGNGIFVAVGYQGDLLRTYDSVILVSDGGRSWTAYGLGFSGEAPTSILWDGSRFLVGGSAGGMATSSDGTSWSTFDSSLGGRINDLIWTGSLYMAVGNSGLIATSADGQTWSKQEPPVTSHLRQVAYTGSVYVVVGSSNTILTSSDGVEWVTQADSSTYWSDGGSTWGGGDINSLVWSPSENALYATHNSLILAGDASGENWAFHLDIETLFDDREFGTYRLKHLIHDGTRLVGVGTPGVILDGDATGWTVRSKNHTGHDLNAGITHDGKFVAVGKNNITLMEQGGTWSGDLNHWDSLAAVAWTGTRYLAITTATYNSGGGRVMVRDEDGTSWDFIADNSVFTKRLRDIVWLGTSAVIVGDGGAVYTSSNGETWEAPESGVTNNLNGVTWNGSRIVGVGRNGAVITSGNGLSWSTADAGQINMEDVTWTGSRFVAVGLGVVDDDWTGAAAVSSDGSQWQLVNTGQYCPFYAVAAHGNSLLAVGKYGCYAASGDGGVSWTTGEISLPYWNFNDVVAMDDGTFRAVGEEGIVIEFR